MSGLGEMGDMYAANVNALQVQQKDLDQYDIVNIDNPSVSATWFGTCNGGTAASGPAITLLNQIAEWPRNICYTIAGVSGGTFGGTFNVNLVDQFGQNQTESVVVASAANGGTVYGTVIAAKFLSGTFTSQGSSGGSAGTAQVGFGTTENGSAQSNWFGLLTKIGGTADVKHIRWDNNGTVTGLNKGTAIGTLVDTTRHAFQGTSGVAVTDTYTVILKPTYDNTFKGTMSAL